MHVAGERSGIGRELVNALLMGLAIIGLCLIGMATRSDLASFWPANAFAAGMMIRFPSLARPFTWVAVALGFFVTDAMTGNTLVNNLVLNGGNMMSIAIAYWCLSRFDKDDQRLTTPLSVFRLMGAMAVASFAIGLLGMIADPLMFGNPSLPAFVFWSTTELMNYAAFLPMLLALPTQTDARNTLGSIGRFDWRDAMPALTVVAACILGAMIGGPGAIAIPLLAMLWCATHYGLFTTTTIAFLFIAWTLLAISFGILDVADHRNDRSVLLSIRFGVAVLGLAPVVVSSVMQSQRRMADELYRLSMEDGLTGLLNRRAFQVHGSKLLSDARRNNQPVAMVMLDIDHFKRVNDTFGHPTGDALLRDLSGKLQNSTRAGDLAARWGGEEFTILLRNCSPADAERIAQRVKDAFEKTEFDTDHDGTVRATLSAGIASSTAPHSLDQLLGVADRALYMAKDAGRNRTVSLDADEPA